MKFKIIGIPALVLAIGLSTSGVEARGHHHGAHAHRHLAHRHRAPAHWRLHRAHRHHALAHWRRHRSRHYFPTHRHYAGTYGSHAAHGGFASWYGAGLRGHRTANGERFNAGAFTAAHRFWPFGTRVRVTNRRNGRSVVVRINDRGPFVGGRVIDLSAASARAIGMGGTDPVSLARL